MIVWINGAFGSGKTHAAYELKKRLEKAFVFDPEEAGFYIRKNLPKEIHESDFQDYHMWRSFNYKMLCKIASDYDGIIIVPMTLTSHDYYDQIISQLKMDYNLKHFTLSAKKSTLEKRLLKRGDKMGSWAFDQIDRCIHAFKDDRFQNHIETDELSINEVVEAIANKAGLTISEDKRSFFKRKKDRFVIKLRHHRWL